jgi:hypothetical protein
MSITIQPFKGNDVTEQKMRAALVPVAEELVEARDDFYNGAYECYKLGDVLYDTNRHPMVGVISKETFREIFPQINQAFKRPGIFEYYLDLLRAIYGEDVVVNFEIPAPGVLYINIQGLVVTNYNFVAREISGGEYFYSPVVDHDGDNILFQHTDGLKTQSEIDSIMKEISPQGIYVKANLLTT